MAATPAEARELHVNAVKELLAMAAVKEVVGRIVSKLV